MCYTYTVYVDGHQQLPLSHHPSDHIYTTFTRHKAQGTQHATRHGLLMGEEKQKKKEKKRKRKRKRKKKKEKENNHMPFIHSNLNSSSSSPLIILSSPEDYIQ